MRALISITVVAFMLASSAEAAACRNPATGKPMRCVSSTATTARTARVAGGSCSTGIRCGNRCLKSGTVCRRPR